MNELSPITIKLLEVSHEINLMKGLSDVDQCLRDAAVELIDEALEDLDELRDESLKELIRMGDSSKLSASEQVFIEEYHLMRKEAPAKAA